MTAVGHADDLRDAVADLGPLDAELPRELGPQHGLVGQAGGTSVGVEPPTVQRRPLEIGAARDVGDDDVGVQLRVAGAGGPVPERRGGEPVGLHHDRPAVPAAHARGVALEVAERLADRVVVGARTASVSPSANRTLTLFGAEKVRSNAATRTGLFEFRSGSPVRG